MGGSREARGYLYAAPLLPAIDDQLCCGAMLFVLRLYGTAVLLDVTHGHLDVGVAQLALQSDCVAATRREFARECVAKAVRVHVWSCPGFADTLLSEDNDDG